MRDASSLILDRILIVDQFFKYTALPHYFDNNVYCIAEVIHDGQRIIEHHLQSVCGRVQSWMKGFNVDSLI
jgi:hypothetical protein